MIDSYEHWAVEQGAVVIPDGSLQNGLIGSFIFISAILFIIFIISKL